MTRMLEKSHHANKIYILAGSGRVRPADQMACAPREAASPQLMLGVVGTVRASGPGPAIKEVTS